MVLEHAVLTPCWSLSTLSLHHVVLEQQLVDASRMRASEAIDESRYRAMIASVDMGTSGGWEIYART